MSHSYASIRLHIVFSTKERRPFIATESQPRLWAYTAGVARKIGGEAIEIGGMPDHMHALVAIPATLTVAELIQKLKANSSRWMHENGASAFEWQKGYGVFSVSASATESVRSYIRNQAEHHKRHTFEEEFVSLLKRYGIEYDAERILE
jgi:putative transposase